MCVSVELILFSFYFCDDSLAPIFESSRCSLSHRHHQQQLQLQHIHHHHLQSAPVRLFTEEAVKNIIDSHHHHHPQLSVILHLIAIIVNSTTTINTSQPATTPPEERGVRTFSRSPCYRSLYFAPLFVLFLIHQHFTHTHWIGLELPACLQLHCVTCTTAVSSARRHSFILSLLVRQPPWSGRPTMSHSYHIKTEIPLTSTTTCSKIMSSGVISGGTKMGLQALAEVAIGRLLEEQDEAAAAAATAASTKVIDREFASFQRFFCLFALLRRAISFIH